MQGLSIANLAADPVVFNLPVRRGSGHEINGRGFDLRHGPAVADNDFGLVIHGNRLVGRASVARFSQSSPRTGRKACATKQLC